MTWTRRDFLKTSAATAGALAAGPALADFTALKSERQLRILILGGTRFLGPATIEVALNEYLVMFGRHGRVVDNVEFRSVGYFEIGLTAMEHRFRETVFDYRDSETKIGLAGNGGFMLLLDENLAFDLSGSLTLKPGFTDGTPFGLLMGGHLGLVAFF